MNKSELEVMEKLKYVPDPAHSISLKLDKLLKIPGEKRYSINNLLGSCSNYCSFFAWAAFLARFTSGHHYSDEVDFSENAKRLIKAKKMKDQEALDVATDAAALDATVGIHEMLDSIANGRTFLRRGIEKTDAISYKQR